MIIAAALMMRLEAGWQVGGYPASALAFLSMVGVAGFVLAGRVTVSDRFDE